MKIKIILFITLFSLFSCKINETLINKGGLIYYSTNGRKLVEGTFIGFDEKGDYIILTRDSFRMHLPFEYIKFPQ